MKLPTEIQFKISQNILKSIHQRKKMASFDSTDLSRKLSWSIYFWI